MRAQPDYSRLPKPPGEGSWKKALVWVLGGIAVLFFILVLVGIIVSAIEDDDEVAASPPMTPIVVPTATAPSTPFPMPTAQPTPVPTPTPRPTPTVTPTPLPVSECDTQEAQAYIDQLGPVTEQLARNSQDVGRLFGLAGADGTLILDFDWQLQTAAVMAEINVGAESLLELNAPQVFSAADNDLKASARLLKQFVELAVTGIDNLDPANILAANDALTRASTLVVSATEKLTNVCE